MPKATKISPSEIITIEYQNKNDYTVKSLFVSNDQDMYASTSAIP